ncbi:AAA family ATPase, partial [Burkholderia cenocepacia]|uniref:AAA family ATPase n=2 Tax=Pseudomonadota TaxID=1224 RepID=UPI00222F1E1B
MKKIAFLAQKGGSGKTTLAVHTAVAATEAGESVVVIDTDPQKSATVWGDARSQEVPIVATAAASELGRVLEAADQERMTLAIVDTAPHAAPDATRIVR